MKTLTQNTLIKVITTILLLFGGPSLLAVEKVAKVIILKGEVLAYKADSKKGRNLKKGDWVSEGEIVKCGNRSFAKLLFIDKSQINVSPNSEMQVKTFPRKQAGILKLIKGKVRAKVTKNYMEINPKKSKLFIHTETAAMGVRGTDFQVIYNPRNSHTSLLTFEGAVAMAQLNDSARTRINQDNLEGVLHRREAVIVRQGQYSGTSNNRVSIPVKISPTQLESLKSSEGTSSSSKPKSAAKKKVVRSIVPKGLDPKKVAEVNKQNVDSTIGANIKSAVGEIKVTSGPPPEGFRDSRTGAFAPPAGGFVDQKTGLYVPPVEGSTFDPNAGVYVPPPEVGSVDVDTGDYVPPSGYTLTDEGDLTQVSESGGRMPASVDGVEPTPIVNVIDESQKEFTTDSGDSTVSTQFDQNDPNSQILDDFQRDTISKDFDNPPPPRRRDTRPRVRLRLRKQ